MAVKLHIRKTLLARFILSRWGKIFIVSSVLTLAIGVGIFAYYYVYYARIIEEKLAAGPYGSTSLLYAAPRPVMVGDEGVGQLQEIAQYLRRCGYTESNTSRMGWYHLRPDAIEINPGPDAYDSEGATIKVEKTKVTQIISLRDHTERTRFMLEPELMTNLFDRERKKRRLVKFDEIPRVMVNALLSAEDKHFFQHPGFDPAGIVRAAYVDVKQRRGGQGASTLSQQLARTLWLGPERGLRRKIPETFITLYLEQKLTKQQIFEFYANSIYLGNVGSFSINGFGEGAQAYFGKDLKMISLPEAATLAGLINSPRRRNPFFYPDAAKERRNVVLKLMRENGQISQRDLEDALSAPMKVTRESGESTDAPYFVDLVNQTLQSRFQDRDFQTNSYRVYTTLDMNLQRDAVTAVREGIKETDDQWKRRNKKYGTNDDNPLAQVALICLDAETGELKALVGGRNYGVSQLDHALAKRQPGSSFKPFVYAAAFTEALKGGANVLTPASTVVDEPTTFYFNDQPPYEPHNHGDKYNGTVTLRYALAHSLNIPAVKVAEMIGYDNVAKTAHSVGLNIDIKPTPSIALGSYEVMPLEIAGAYTVFTNNGDRVKPTFIKTIRDQQGASIFEEQGERKPKALDPKVAYLVENMMEEVLRSGTGADVPYRFHFTLPAAGKTGTSRDGWFAGFTSKLICVVWVGFDDNRDFKLEGARSALPIWATFMNLAHKQREYQHVHAFSAPDGIVTADIDAETGLLATANCPKTRSEVFLAGTQPIEMCTLHGGGTQITDWNADKKNQDDKDPSKKGKGFLGRLKGIFK
ncbi:MAG TPA: PBP1A family penicillin-binding protein [Bryobacteraceae bacterium]|nr:PBP1A family penicillin-binding protein [Bryobacteraceae bacterium]